MDPLTPRRSSPSTCDGEGDRRRWWRGLGEAVLYAAALTAAAFALLAVTP